MVMDAVRIQLSAPGLISGYVDPYRIERRGRESDAKRGRAATERALAGVMAKIRRIGDSRVDGTPDKSMGRWQASSFCRELNARSTSWKSEGNCPACSARMFRLLRW